MSLFDTHDDIASDVYIDGVEQDEYEELDERTEEDED
jgi:hypothetical protein